MNKIIEIVREIAIKNNMRTDELSITEYALMYAMGEKSQIEEQLKKIKTNLQEAK